MTISIFSFLPWSLLLIRLLILYTFAIIVFIVACSENDTQQGGELSSGSNAGDSSSSDMSPSLDSSTGDAMLSPDTTQAQGLGSPMDSAMAMDIREPTDEGNIAEDMFSPPVSGGQAAHCVLLSDSLRTSSEVTEILVSPAGPRLVEVNDMTMTLRQAVNSATSGSI